MATSRPQPSRLLTVEATHRLWEERTKLVQVIEDANVVVHATKHHDVRSVNT